MHKLILDIGSNALKGSLYDARTGAIQRDWRIVTGIGRDVAPDGTIGPEAESRLIAAAKQVLWEAAAIDGSPVPAHAIATEAFRRAANRDAIARRFGEATDGTVLEVIAGDEEARLERVAVLQTQRVQQNPGVPFFHVDAGGSSTECSVLDGAHAVAFTHSFPFGRHALLAMRPERPIALCDLLAELRRRIDDVHPRFATLAGSSVLSYLKATGQHRDDPVRAGLPIPTDADDGAVAGSLLVSALASVFDGPMYATKAGVRHGWIAEHLDPAT